MKKTWLWAFIMALLMLCLLTACGKNENALAPEAPKDPSNLNEAERVIAISSQGRGIETVFRKDKDGTILFSPDITELWERVKADEKTDGYTVSLRFIVNDGLQPYYAYPVLTLPFAAASEDGFDVTLVGKDYSCGFCPTSGRYYTVELTVLEKGRAVMQGIWERLYVPSSLASSPYYDPTPIPTEEQRQELSFTVQYLAQEGGSVTGKTVQTLVLGTYTEAVTAVAKEGYLFAGWSDGVMSETREKDVIVYDRTIYAKFTDHSIDAGVANMYIETEDHERIASRKQYVNAHISIAGASEDRYNVSLTTKIRCRGNSSYSSTTAMDAYVSKNSYRIKLDQKANLLGVGSSSNRDWVLHSNKFDASHMHNYFVWNLAARMGTIPFVPHCTWVNLYINGDYRGVYMLSEHVEAAKGRVDVDDDGTDPDKGYLVELDFRGQDETGAVEGLNYFYVPGFYDTGIKNLREWVIKSEVTTREECAFIRDYFIRCHEAMMSGDRSRIDALVDIDSIVDMFILQELAKDVDGGGASIYWQKDKGGKLYFTAPWDYDFGFGFFGVAVSHTEFVCEIEGPGNIPNLWLQNLLKQDWFLAQLYVRMLEVTDMVAQVQRDVRETGAMLQAASDRNDARWGIYGRKYESNVHDQASVMLKDYGEHVSFLCDWVDLRMEWMLETVWQRLLG